MHTKFDRRGLNKDEHSNLIAIRENLLNQLQGLSYEEAFYLLESATTLLKDLCKVQKAPDTTS